MDRQIGRILDRPRTQAWLVADADVTDGVADLIGHLVYEDDPVPLVYFCYVKHDWRGNGFARGLLRAAEIDIARPFNYVCHTYMTDNLLKAGKMRHANWRPLLGRYGDGEDRGRDQEATG